MIENPRVRLTLDHMRHEIEHAFFTHTEGMREQVKVSLKRAIEEFDYDTEIRRIAHGIIQQEIESSIRASFRGMQDNVSMKRAMAKLIAKEVGASAEAAIANAKDIKWTP